MSDLQVLGTFFEGHSHDIADYRSEYFRVFGRIDDEHPRFESFFSALPYLWATDLAAYTDVARGQAKVDCPLTRFLTEKKSWSLSWLLTLTLVVAEKVRLTDDQLIVANQLRFAGTEPRRSYTVRLRVPEASWISDNTYAITGFAFLRDGELQLLEGWVPLTRDEYDGWQKEVRETHPEDPACLANQLDWLLRYATALRRYNNKDFRAVARQVQHIRPIEVPHA